nr:hypothetical protein [Tanacetum cinerariifolium]
EAEEQVIAPVVDMDDDIAMLFGDDDFKDDESEGFDDEEVWETWTSCTSISDRGFKYPHG